MLWLEREVVATLVSPTLDDQKRAEIETYVDDSLRSMPEHLRVGMAAESILFGAWPRVQGALGRYDRGSMNARRALEGEPLRPGPPIRATAALAGPVRRARAHAGGVAMKTPEATLDADVLVIGSGAGGAATAATLAAAGHDVTVVEEGPWIDPDALEPFSLEEMAAKYRHRGLAAALGNPAIAFAEGRCVGGSTEINSGLYHRLPGAPRRVVAPRIRHRGVRLGHARLLCRAHREPARSVAAPGRPTAVVGAARAGCDQARMAGSRVRTRVPVRRRRPGRQADDVTHAAAAGGRCRRNRDPELPGTPALAARRTSHRCPL